MDNSLQSNRHLDSFYAHCCQQFLFISLCLVCGDVLLNVSSLQIFIQQDKSDPVRFWREPVGKRFWLILPPSQSWLTFHRQTFPKTSVLALHCDFSNGASNWFWYSVFMFNMTKPACTINLDLNNNNNCDFIDLHLYTIQLNLSESLAFRWCRWLLITNMINQMYHITN